MTAPELSPEEAAIVARFAAAPYPAEVLLSHLTVVTPAPHWGPCDRPQPEYPPACTVYSHGDSGWHCSLTGPHDQHWNAAGDVTW